MNLTKKMEEIIEELGMMRKFNGIPIIASHYEKEDKKREDGKSDGMPDEVIDFWVNNYTCCGFHFDPFDSFYNPHGYNDNENSYLSVEFNERKFIEDLREWLTERIGDASVIPKNLDIYGGDNEFMVPGYGERIREIENSIDK